MMVELPSGMNLSGPQKLSTSMQENKQNGMKIFNHVEFWDYMGVVDL